MPYIKPEDYARAIQDPATPGELNYAITCRAIFTLQGIMVHAEFGPTVDRLVLGYLDRVGMSYTNANAVMGVLDCAARELERRVTAKGSAEVWSLSGSLGNLRDTLYNEQLAPYEDKKIAENGDVFPTEMTNGS